MGDIAPLSSAPLGQWVVVVTAGRMVEARFNGFGWRNRDNQIIASTIDGWLPNEPTSERHP